MSVLLRFPGGKERALTLSYDDGVEQDARLIALMQKHGLKGTFNIGSGLYAEEGHVYPAGTVHRRMSRSQCKALYVNSGMEVAVHGLTHPFLDRLPANICTHEILQDRINLEEEYGCIIRGMAYPYGAYSDDVVKALKSCGIAYARTTVSTGKFDIPTDWLRMSATCHHNDPRLMELAEEFLGPVSLDRSKLFYLWGHSYEFEGNDNWHVIEAFAEKVGNRDDVWYATNIEVYDYVTAFGNLVFSTRGDKVYNPGDKEVFFYTGKGTYSVKPGETVYL